MFGGALALASALAFALNNATFRRGALTGSVAQAMAVTVPLGAVLFLVAALASGQLYRIAEFSGAAIFWLVLAGILHFIAGRYCNYRATQLMGTTPVGPIQESSLIVTLVLAIAVLGESLSVLQLVGIALVTAGPLVMRALMRGRKQAPESAPVDGIAAKPVFTPNFREGTVYALLSALAFGTSPIFVGLAFEADMGIAGGLLGGLVSYLAATAVIALLLVPRARRDHVRALGSGPAKWFVVSGCLVCVSHMLRYMALAVAPVSVVAPIMRTALLFRLFFARLINPDHEVFGAGIVAGTLVSLAGVVMISTSTDVVASLLNLSEGARAVLALSWP